MADEKPTPTAGGDAAAAKPAKKGSDDAIVPPLAWLKDPETGDVFAASTPADVANMRAIGYTPAAPPKGMPDATGTPA